ncbi:s-adenosyl-l-methionine-dependent methyltransferases superfamily protein [Anaeramoeba ignava]|uniref:S-adenosyl-l-methionine-dependent methyltransferases superfamily protein n=1 Tax=Anaeramoeba ignava TaxID=1746090 RepID=A0A9Q0LC26_ANAIG|nr:s-adenosyl-l-methionine-dependent methyltransferases superfamily protein [Anaeramoeba ignava]
MNFTKKEYWDNIYSSEKQEMDWYSTFSKIYPKIKHCFIDKSMKILQIGCGTSNFAKKLYQKGFSEITNIDISETAIEKMKKKYQNLSIKFEIMDTRNLTFKDESFDCIIDKGTLDSLLTEYPKENSLKMLSEIYRIMKPNSIFIEITWGTPFDRMFYLKNKKFKWKISHKIISCEKEEEKFTFYIYFLRKGKENEETKKG